MRIEYLADREDLLDEVGRLHFEEWGYLTPSQTLRDRIEKLRTCCGRDEIPTTFVATSEEGLLGTAMLLVSDMQTRTDLSPWLGGVYVKSRHRGGGVATALVEHAAGVATGQGAAALYLYTMPPMEAFYTARGWHTIQRCEYRSTRVVVMSRPLPG